MVPQRITLQEKAGFRDRHHRVNDTFLYLSVPELVEAGGCDNGGE
jgi:hypothetical protein